MLFYHLIVLDASGSMDCIRKNALSGCNETIQSIRSLQTKANGEHQHFLSLVTFNSEAPQRVIYERVPINNVQELTMEQYVPDGCTPLYDALGKSMNALHKAIDKSQENSVLVTVITDGLENSSTEYSADNIRKQVEEFKQSGWTFAFIGANIDEVMEAGKLGIHNSLRFEQTEAGTQEMFDCFKESVARFCCEAPMGKSAAKRDRDFFVRKK